MLKIEVNFVLVLILRAFILYIFIIVLMRIMGKREIGQLQPFELAITLIIADLIVIPMENTGVPLINGIIPVLVITFSQMLFSYLTVKNERIQQLMSGTPTVMIRNGKLIEQNLVSQNYNITELLEQLRLNGVNKIQDVECAMLETNGQLSVILKEMKSPVTVEDMGVIKPYEGIPIEVILDGKYISENLEIADVTLEDINKELEKNSITVDKVFFASVDAQKNFVIQEKQVWNR